MYQNWANPGLSSGCCHRLPCQRWSGQARMAFSSMSMAAPNWDQRTTGQLRITNEELRIDMLATLCGFLDRCDDAAELVGITVNAVELGGGQVIRVPKKA